MASYKYEGYDSFSTKVNGIVEANSLEEAKRLLSSKKIVYTSISKSLEFLWFKSEKLKNEALSSLLKDLSVYTASGVTVTNAVKLCAIGRRNNKTLKGYLERIVQKLEEGNGFYRALSNDEYIRLPQYVLQTIKSAEEGAFLQKAFENLHTAIVQKMLFSAEIKKALTYPMFIVFSSLLLLSVMLTVAVPVMVETFAKTSNELPAITKTVIAVSNFFQNYKFTLLAFVVVATVSISALLKFSPKTAMSLSKAKLSLWPTKRFFIRSELSKFLFVVSMLSSAGITLSKAFRLGVEAIDNIYLKTLFLEVSNAVNEGTPLSKALQKVPKLDDTLIQTVYLGEESSSLATAMLTLSNMYAEQNRRDAAIFVSLLEPVLMLVIGGFVGVILIAMLLPIMSISI